MDGIIKLSDISDAYRCILKVHILSFDGGFGKVHVRFVHSMQQRTLDMGIYATCFLPRFSSSTP